MIMAMQASGGARHKADSVYSQHSHKSSSTTNQPLERKKSESKTSRHSMHRAASGKTNIRMAGAQIISSSNAIKYPQ